MYLSQKIKLKLQGEVFLVRQNIISQVGIEPKHKA